ncbi:long-chain fatty acid--CoA ligase [Motiliproteus sp. MSK22-1]|nr:AMP-binding protein [Motiliproteus sp. MSK22-1]OMH39806.1 long-chain fatty acid--CoA ligase [Motiliproteus sp. MSK22-1]
MNADSFENELIDFGVYETLIDLFDDSCDRYADQPAFSNLGKTLTYRNLRQSVNDFTAFLQHQTNLVPGDRIAIQLPNLLQYPIVLFSALRAGLVVVNTNPLYTAEEMEFQFKDSGAKALVVLANMAHLVEKVVDKTDINTVIVTEVGDALGPMRRLLVNGVIKHIKRMIPDYHLPQAISFTNAMKAGAKLNVNAVSVSRNDTALLQYTGGTTGIAKGAMLSHANILANVLQVKDLLSKVTSVGQETTIAPLPLYHIYSFTLNCVLMMEMGNHVVLITNPRDISAFIKELKKWKFTVFSGLNTLFVALCKNPGFSELDFSHLKLTLSGGMALTQAAADRWKAMTGCEVIEGYGLTETSPIVSVNPPDGVQLGTIGPPIPGTEVQLLDEDGSVVPKDGIGELCVRGPQVMKGYWQKPEETDLVLSVDGWLKTGDIAQIQDDGYIRIVDRKKDMINVSGFNVYPNELEEIISGHPDIDECVAIGLPCDSSGELIKLFVVSRNLQLSVNQVRDYARERLTAYKVPSQVEFRTVLPKSNIGKVLRRALRDEELNKLATNGKTNGRKP